MMSAKCHVCDFQLSPYTGYFVDQSSKHHLCSGCFEKYTIDKYDDSKKSNKKCMYCRSSQRVYRVHWVGKLNCLYMCDLCILDKRHRYSSSAI